MKPLILTLFFLCMLLTGYAQQGIVFTHKSSKKEVMVKEGDLVKFSYNGYIGQREVKYGTVLSIQDSVIGIIAPTGKFSGGGTETRYIYIKDLTGFRRFHKSRPYLMSLSNISVTVGSIFLFYAIDRTTDLTFTEKLGVSIGTGLISTSLVRLAFPERIKNKIGTDWEVTVLK